MSTISDGAVLIGTISDGAENLGGEAEGGEGADPDGTGVHTELLGPFAPPRDGTFAHTCRRDLSDPPPQRGTSRQSKEPPHRTGHSRDSDDREQGCAADNEDEAEDPRERAVGEDQDESAEGKKPGTDRKTHEPTLTGKSPLVGNDATGHGALATTR